jgi:hypothetical protein
MLPNNSWTVCLEVQKYLQAKYDIDFITSRTKIFPLAKKLKGQDFDSIEEMAENLYRLYRKESGLMIQKKFIVDKIESILFWSKVPPLQENRELWERIIKNNIPTKIDKETGILFYQSSEISSINSDDGIKFDAYMR